MYLKIEKDPLFDKNVQKAGLIHLKVVTYSDTKCTPYRPFV